MISINGSSIKYQPFHHGPLDNVHSEAVLAVVNKGFLITKKVVILQLKNLLEYGLFLRKKHFWIWMRRAVSFGEWQKKSEKTPSNPVYSIYACFSRNIGLMKI